MRILVLGGYGHIGAPVCRGLIAAGHEVTGLGRSIDAGRKQCPQAKWVAADIAGLDSSAAWARHIDGQDVIVNAAGALQDGSRDTLVKVHGEAMEALMSACEAQGETMIVQISAPNASVDAATSFLRTKAAADDRLRRSTLRWVILRPGLVIGHGAYGGTALLRAFAALRFVKPWRVVRQARVQSVAMEDLVEVVVEACEGKLPSGTDVDVLEDENHDFATVLRAFQRWLAGSESPWALPCPQLVGRLTAKVADFCGYLGWRSPLRSNAIELLEQGVTGDADTLAQLRGKRLSTLEQTLRALPCTLQERWFARLFLVMPLCVVTLSLFWLLSGLIAIHSFDAAVAVFERGASTLLSPQVAVIGGIVADLGLGIAVLFRRAARFACWGMIAVSCAYLAAGTLLLPELWADPLGPYVKVIPTLLLAYVLCVLLEER